MQDLTGKQGLRLSELNGLIKTAISENFPGQYWIIAEIADLKLNQKGHCYLELVEKDGDTVIAQVKAAIWSYEYRSINSRFRNQTGEQLKQGMKILFSASLLFHEVYGLSLNIREVDPSYTMGEMARKKKEVIERLRKEGLLEKNRSLDLPLVPQRIAVISSPTAAGYQDFFDQLDNNPYKYRFTHILFPAIMQGHDAEDSIVSALNAIRKTKGSFDITVIIRGGGSVVDLSSFDGYALAAEIAGFPLPVITGIGHEKDDTVADMAAHTKMKTPTAVAEFLISGVRGFEENILGIETRIVSHANEMIRDAKSRLLTLGQRLTMLPSMLLSAQQGRLLMFGRDLAAGALRRFMDERSRIDRIDLTVHHLDPVNVLKRGYSITTLRGKALKDAALLKNGMIIETRLHKGTVKSIVQSGKDGKTDGKKQGTDLLPGFE